MNSTPSASPALIAPNTQQAVAGVDYSVHGIVGIRLLDASPEDAKMVGRQLGLTPSPCTRDPEIVIKFVDQLPVPSRMYLLDLDDVAYSDNEFLLLRTKTGQGKRARVQIAFDGIGEQCLIVCEKGVTLVPLLVPILNLTMLAKGFIPLHASAFTFNGTGVLVTGWAKGGKTETLLAFAANGANYLGDEWIYISQDGKQMYGIPFPIRLREWILRELPQYQALLDRSERLRLWAVRQLMKSIDWVTASDLQRLPFLPGTAERIKPLFKHQLYATMSPRKLFGERMGPLVANLDKLIFAVSHNNPEVVVQPVDPQDIGRRVASSVEHEWLNLFAAYLKFQFAFPERRNALIERAATLEREMLLRALAHTEAYAVSHPYPVSIQALYDAILPLCR